MAEFREVTMYFSTYNEPLVETPSAPPPVQEPPRAAEAPPAPRPPRPTAVPPLHGTIRPANHGPERNGGEGGSAIVLLVIVLVMSAVAVIVGLRWQYFAPSSSVFDYPGGGFVLPNAAPAPTGRLERAPTGDGTTLTLAGREGGQAMTLQEIYKKVAPSVVSVTVMENLAVGQGTGVIMSADGYIITNAHVIEGGSKAEITLEDGRTFSALLVGKDTATDLAVLKIDVSGLPAAEFGSSDDMVVGDTVAAIGNPLGQELRGTMTDGILSAISRDMEVDGYQMTLMQTTAALNSGNSGGALVNDGGQVIGITNMKMVQSGFDAPVEGLGFAIPTTTVKAVVDALIDVGHVTGRPVLGITVRPAYPGELADAGTEYGLMVNSVEEKSDAWTQGIRSGDLILEADGIQLYQNEDLLGVKSDLSVGDGIAMKVFRDGKTREVTVTLVEQYTTNGD